MATQRFHVNWKYLLQHLGQEELTEVKKLIGTLLGSEHMQGVSQDKVDTADRQQLTQLLTRHSKPDWAQLLFVTLLHKINRRDLLKVAQFREGEMQRKHTARLSPTTVDRIVKHLENDELTEIQALMEQEPEEEDEDYPTLSEEMIVIGKWLDYRAILSQKLMASWEKNFWPMGTKEAYLQQATRRSLAMLPLYNSHLLWESISYRTPMVLCGMAGVGKTTVVKQLVLDWLSGQLPRNFSVVFYLSCAELNHCPPSSLADLLSWNCADLRDAMPELLELPEHILLVVDGLDQLQAIEGAFMDDLCHSWKDVRPVPALLGSLLSKTLLAQTTLVATTRPTRRKDLNLLLTQVELVWLQGFNKEDQLDFIKQELDQAGELGSKSQALQVLGVLWDHVVLQGMLRLPAVCWLACRCLRQQMQQKLDPNPLCTTASRLLLRFLSCSFSYNPKLHESLASACLLATHCVWSCRSVFNSEDLEQLGVPESHLQPFLDAKVLRQQDDWGCCYTFLHLSVQQLLAAIHYVLEHERGVSGSHRGTIKDMEKVFSHTERLLNPYLEQVGYFLLGFLNLENTLELENLFRIRLTKYFRNEVRRLTVQLLQPSPTGKVRELMRSLYEAQNVKLLTDVGPSIRELDLELNTKMDAVRAGFCLKHFEDLQSLRLHVHEAVFHKEDENQEEEEEEEFCHMGHCDILNEDSSKKYQRPAEDPSVLSSWKDLCTVFNTNEKLTFLKISTSCFSHDSVKILCDSLGTSDCWLQKVVISRISPETAYQDICTALYGHPKLTHLTLKGNDLVQEFLLPSLSHVLTRPGCKLQSLRLKCCGGTREQWAKFAASVDNGSLLNLSIQDSELADKGASHLLKTLAQPSCLLQRMALEGCHLTEAYCKELSFFLTVTKITHLSLACNNLGDKGLAALCGGLEFTTCHLQTLVLWDCRITKVGCETLGLFLGQLGKIQHLDLGMNPIGMWGLNHLCEALKSPLCSLKTLWLQDCDIQIDSCQEVVSALKVNKTLTTLDLSENIIDTSTSRKLCEALINCNTNLRKLRLNFREQDPEVEQLQEMASSYSSKMVIECDDTHAFLARPSSREFIQ